MGKSKRVSDWGSSLFDIFDFLKALFYLIVNKLYFASSKFTSLSSSTTTLTGPNILLDSNRHDNSDDINMEKKSGEIYCRNRVRVTFDDPNKRNSDDISSEQKSRVSESEETNDYMYKSHSNPIAAVPPMDNIDIDLDTFDNSTRLYFADEKDERPDLYEKENSIAKDDDNNKEVTDEYDRNNEGLQFCYVCQEQSKLNCSRCGTISYCRYV